MLCTYVIYSSQFQILRIIIISNDTNLQIGKEKRKEKKNLSKRTRTTTKHKPKERKTITNPCNLYSTPNFNSTKESKTFVVTPEHQ